VGRKQPIAPAQINSRLVKFCMARSPRTHENSVRVRGKEKKP
jgi:hypothetical protein